MINIIEGALAALEDIEEYQLAEEIPYPGAKPMYLIDIEDKELINTIIDKLVDNI